MTDFDQLQAMWEIVDAENVHDCASLASMDTAVEGLHYALPLLLAAVRAADAMRECLTDQGVPIHSLWTVTRLLRDYDTTRAALREMVNP